MSTTGDLITGSVKSTSESDGSTTTSTTQYNTQNGSKVISQSTTVDDAAKTKDKTIDISDATVNIGGYDINILYLIGGSALIVGVVMLSMKK